MANMIDNFLAMDNSKKVVYLVLLAGAVVGTVMLFQWASQPEYQTLYSNLSPEDASSIVEKLKEKRIPYKLEGGTVVSVASEKIYETRLELAGAGLPRGGGIGFELFDKSNIGMTEFSQKVNYVRAIQGELARTVGWLSEVETARVHIVVPEKRLFGEKKDTATASIVIKLKSGRKLSDDKVQGIVHLVASSVNGLTPEGVTVVDTEGRLLTRAVDSSNPIVLTSSQLDYQRSFEKDIESRIQGIIEPVVGTGKVIARVSAELDFKRVERTEEKFDPDGAVVRSEQRNKEKSSGETVSAGVPGVASNVPGGQPAIARTEISPAQSQRQNEVVNYEINKTVSHIIEPTGNLKRLSVAVLVDGSYEVTKAAEGGKEERKYTPRSQDQLNKFSDLIKGAVGFMPERGDKVEVINASFEQPAILEDSGLAEESMLKQYLPALVRYGVIAVLSIMLFLFVLRPLITGLFTNQGSGLIESSLPEALKALEQGAGGRALAGAKDARQSIIEMAKQNPQQAAQIMKTWMKEK